MSTNRELVDKAWVEFMQTTITGKQYYAHPRPGHWQNGKGLLDQVEDVPVAPSSDIPPIPAMSNPAKPVPLSGQSNILDGGGGDAVVSDYLLAQGTDRTQDAVLLCQNAKTFLVEGVLTHSPYLQTGPGQTGFGYGMRFRNIGTLYLQDSQSTGEGLAQVIIEPSVGRVVFVRFHVEAMHPVWHTAKGAVCEVHTDCLQGYSGGSAPGTKLEFYDSTLRSCGSLLQLQTLISGAVYHRLNLEQVPLQASDEMPYATDKSNVFPTDSRDVWIHALGTEYGYNWQGNQPAYYQPGGPCNNTGEAWHEGVPPAGDFCPKR